MIPPIVCFTCGKPIADKYDYYLNEVKKLQSEKNEGVKTPQHFDGVMSGKIMDKLGLKRYCCRRMMLGTEDMMDVI